MDAQGRSGRRVRVRHRARAGRASLRAHHGGPGIAGQDGETLPAERAVELLPKKPEAPPKPARGHLAAPYGLVEGADGREPEVGGRLRGGEPRACRGHCLHERHHDRNLSSTLEGRCFIFFRASLRFWTRTLGARAPLMKAHIRVLDTEASVFGMRRYQFLELLLLGELLAADARAAGVSTPTAFPAAS